MTVGDETPVCLTCKWSALMYYYIDVLIACIYDLFDIVNCDCTKPVLFLLCAVRE